MNKTAKALIYLFLIGCISGCETYERPDAEQFIYVNQQSLNLLIGEQVQLKASPTEITYGWKSENLTVATVNSFGLVEAVGEGSTNIITFHGDIQTKVPITVNPIIPLEDIKLAVSKVELEVGGKLVIGASPVPADANDFSRFFWSSDNENVAIVNVMGEITALELGVANITVKAGGITKTITTGIYRSVNVALQKPVTVSSVNSSTYAGNNAVDGINDPANNNNRWVSQPVKNDVPQWIMVDLGAEYKIYSLQFWTQAKYPCADFQFQKEVDGEWVDIFPQTGNTNIAYSKTFEDTMTSKVRLYFTKGSSDGIIRMYEMSVNAKVYE